MNGKILYVEDDASKACESFLTGLLSDLIVPELKQEIENKSGSNGIERRQRSSLALTVTSSKQNKLIEAKELKKIIDKDPRIVYHYDFLAALKFICTEFNNVELCVLDRNLQCSEKQDRIREEIQTLGLKFTENDYNFIAPLNNDGTTRNLNNHREGNYLLEILHEKAGDDILEKIYFLSGYENDLEKDRHHAYILRKFNIEHYIGKKDDKKINFFKTRFAEIQRFENYNIITKYFPHIFDVISEPKLRSFLDKVISNNGTQGDIAPKDFMGNFRQIIEDIYSYLRNPQKIGGVPIIQVPEEIRVRELFKAIYNDKEKYLRHPTSALDVAYTICCDYLHTGTQIVKKQSNFMKSSLESEDDFIYKYVYNSVKLFFTWLKFYR